MPLRPHEGGANTAKSQSLEGVYSLGSKPLVRSIPNFSSNVFIAPRDPPMGTSTDWSDKRKTCKPRVLTDRLHSEGPSSLQVPGSQLGENDNVINSQHTSQGRQGIPLRVGRCYSACTPSNRSVVQVCCRKIQTGVYSSRP